MPNPTLSNAGGSYSAPGTHVLASGLWVVASANVDGNGNTVSDAGYPVLKTNAGGPAPGQTVKEYSGQINLPAGAGTPTQPLETVTAGKTLFVSDISITSNTAQVFEVQLQANGVPIYRGFVKGDTGPLELPGIETQPSAASGAVVQLVFVTLAGFLVTLADFFISGWEQ